MDGEAEGQPAGQGEPEHLPEVPSDVGGGRQQAGVVRPLDVWAASGGRWGAQPAMLVTQQARGGAVETASALDASFPFGRVARPEDVAEVVAFCWVGQGTYEASDWDEAMEEANSLVGSGSDAGGGGRGAAWGVGRERPAAQPGKAGRQCECD